MRWEASTDLLVGRRNPGKQQRGVFSEPKPEVHPCLFCSLTSILNFLSHYIKLCHPSGIFPGTSAQKRHQSENHCPCEQNQSQQYFDSCNDKVDEWRNDIHENQKHKQSPIPLAKLAVFYRWVSLGDGEQKPCIHPNKVRKFNCI